jgi:hypothetical protein
VGGFGGAKKGKEAIMKGTGGSLVVVVILVASVASFAIGNRVGTPSAQLETSIEDSQATQRPRHPIWEYKAVSVPNLVSAEKLLNEMGKEGWELAVVQCGIGSGVMPAQSSSYANVHYILKRSVP